MHAHLSQQAKEKAKKTQTNESRKNKQKQRQGIEALKYIDLDFGPVRNSDTEGNKFSLYKTGEPPRKGYPDPRKVEWVYAENLVGSDAKFVDDGAAS